MKKGYLGSELRNTQGAGAPSHGSGFSTFRVGNHGESLLNVHKAVEAFQDDKRFPKRDFSYVQFPVDDDLGVVSVTLDQFKKDFDWFVDKAERGLIHTIIFENCQWMDIHDRPCALQFKFEQIQKELLSDIGREVKKHDFFSFLQSRDVTLRDKPRVDQGHFEFHFGFVGRDRINLCGSKPYHHYGYFSSYRLDEGADIDQPETGWPIKNRQELPAFIDYSRLPVYSGPKINLKNLKRHDIPSLMDAFKDACPEFVPFIQMYYGHNVSRGKFWHISQNLSSTMKMDVAEFRKSGYRYYYMKPDDVIEIVQDYHDNKPIAYFTTVLYQKPNKEIEKHKRHISNREYNLDHFFTWR